MNEISKTFPDWESGAYVRTLENGIKVKRPSFDRIFTLHIPLNANADSVLKYLNNEPSILFAEKHMDAQLFNDPSYPAQWHLNNTGQSIGGSVDADIDAPEAWQIFTGSSSIKIGVFDTGVDLSHDDFIGKISGDNIPTFGSEGDRYHGTHVAGIAAAKANNGESGRGVDWNAQIVSKRIFGDYGSYLGDNNVVNKILDAVDNQNVDIMNHSWGGTQYKTIIRQAFAYAYKMNTVNSAAMGNDFNNGNPTKYPAAFGQGIIAVGATQNNDIKSPFSQTGSHIDVVAPGGFNNYPFNNSRDILSTWENDGVRYVAGTSMATPQIAGIASLLKGYNSALYNDDIEQIIQLSTDKISGMSGQNFTNEYGYGRVNAHQALLRLQSPYVLNHHTATGGYVANVTQETKIFYDTPGLANGAYVVKRNEVRKTISFPYMSEAHVWGRGVATNGYSSANPNFAMGWNELVSVSNNSATLKTYVYEVFTTSGQRIGWFPASPSNAQFAYTVHGILGTPPPSAPTNFTLTNPGGSFPSFTWNASSTATSYKIYRSCDYGYFGDCTASPQQVGSTSGTSWTDYSVIQNGPGQEDTYRYSAKAFNATGGSPYSNSAVVNAQPSSFKEIGTSLPTEFSFSNNYPNPFNPTTKISYALPEAADVTITVYNIMGQKVVTLVNTSMSAGYHEISFDAGRLSSGVYLARMEAAGQSGQQFIKEVKMQLIK